MLSTLQSLIGVLEKHGEKPALVAFHAKDVERWSYRGLLEQAAQLARGLNEHRGLRPGCAVAFLAGGSAGLVVASLAAIKAGAIIVPLDVQFSDDMLRHVLDDSETRFVFTTRAYAPRLQRIPTALRLEIILLDVGPEDEQSWHRLLVTHSTNGKMHDVRPEDRAALFYTSGTTGPPKGVPLTHGNLAFELNAIRDADLVQADERMLMPLPLHHVYPFVVGLLAPLMLGVPIIFPHSLTGPQIVRALQESEATLVLGVPKLYRAVDAAIEARVKASGALSAAMFRVLLSMSLWLRRRLGIRLGRILFASLHRRFAPKLRYLLCGGSKLDSDLAWKLEALGWRVATGYGLTETSPILAMESLKEGRIGSAGRPLPGVELRIQDGEIQARGPNVFAGYHNLPDRTAEVFTADGWFRTGDLGRLAEDGYLYVTGRASTLIKSEGGEKIQAEELEAIYASAAGIREIAVLQRENRLAGLLVPADPRADEASLRTEIEQVSRRLPSYQRITDYAITHEPLPRTHLGKLQRGELSARFEQAKKGDAAAVKPRPLPIEKMSAEDRALLEEPRVRRVWDWLAERYADRRLTPDSSVQLELGIDSLDWLNLTLEIRQLAEAELTADAIGRIETVRDLLRAVAEEPAGGVSVSPLERPEEVISDAQRRALSPVRWVRSFVGWVVLSLNRMLLRSLFHLNVRGIENVPLRGPFILAPNHASQLDAPAVAAALDDVRLRQVYWLTEFGNFLSKLVTRLPGVMPVEPERAAISSLAAAAAVLKQGHGLVLFPEGARTRTGELQSFKTGVGLLLAHFRIPVVPVYIAGTYEALPAGKTLPSRCPITVIFGQALDTTVLEREGTGAEARDRITSALREQVAKLRKFL